MTSFLKYQRKGSKLILYKVIVLLLIVTKHMYYLLTGWSFVILPIKERAKNAIVNVQDIDQSALLFCLRGILQSETNREF